MNKNQTIVTKRDTEKEKAVEVCTPELAPESALALLASISETVRCTNDNVEKISGGKYRCFDALCRAAKAKEVLIDCTDVVEMPTNTNSIVYNDPIQESLNTIVNALDDSIKERNQAEKNKEILMELGGEDFYEEMVTNLKTVTTVLRFANGAVEICFHFAASIFDTDAISSIHDGQGKYLSSIDDIGRDFDRLDAVKCLRNRIINDGEKRKCVRIFSKLPETLKSSIYGNFVRIKILTKVEDDHTVVLIRLDPWITITKTEIMYDHVMMSLLKRANEAEEGDDEYI